MADRGLRIAYEAMAWSAVNHFTSDAWQTVKRVGAANLGMVVDAFHLFARNRTVADLDGIPMERIFLVQLSDLVSIPPIEAMIETARHHRLLQGQGHFPLASLLDRLHRAGYAGPIGLEVFNDEIKAGDPGYAAKAAMTALRAVLENVGT